MQVETPPAHLRIFTNRTLRLDSIHAIGFDMDYTLARYVRSRMEGLAYRLTIDKLLARGYPAALRQFVYDPAFVIRGLSVDKQLGNVVKLDRHNHAGRVFHGRRKLTQEERRLHYRREMIRFVPPRFALVDTLFSLPEVSIYADLVDLFDRLPGAQKSYAQLFDDTRECIDEAHRDDTLKSAIKADLPAFVDLDPQLPRTLHKLRSAGKKLFLLTNSLWDYTHALMSHLLDHKLPEYPSWQSYFEAIVVGATKPTFFTGSAPLYALDPTGKPQPKPVKRFARGTVYQGGNLRDFEQVAHIAGENVLYIGDHIYGDILRSKKTSLWRTALIIEELEDEIIMGQAHAAQRDQLDALEAERQRLDDLLNAQRQALAHSEREGASAQRHEGLKRERESTKAALRAVLQHMHALQDAINMAFNPSWGMVFKEDRENSRFGEQVSEYACVYTSRVTNFSYYSSQQYFRSPRDLMPHERH